MSTGYESMLEIDLGSIRLSYPYDSQSKRIGFRLYPVSKEEAIVERRSLLNGLPYIDVIPDAGEIKADEVDSLVQLKVVGEEYSGAFAQGETMLFSPRSNEIRFVRQLVEKLDDKVLIRTELESEGLELLHRVEWKMGTEVFSIQVQVKNRSNRILGLEMLSSFLIGGLTPFAANDAPSRMKVHRFRSRWSAESRLESRYLEELHLERSWSGAGTFSERFGQLGTMPVRKWFPFVAVEDTQEAVVWGAQLAWAGSWQMEVSRRNDSVCLSGGLADREFGHWVKNLAPGESMEAPVAYVSCVKGTVEDLCRQLVQHQEESLKNLPAIEQNLPIVVNEWCTTWGDPSHDRLIELADCLRKNQCDAKYLVIDAGWYKTGEGTWNNGHGDWVPSEKLFPQGLKFTADAIRDRGYIPGIWFEMETCGSASHVFQKTDLLLKRDGIPLTVRSRRFWDLRNPEALNYLSERVIGLIKECGFGYLKVDYNETTGLGCDGAESQGEGLRQHVAGIYQFFDRIRQELPDLVIENCSSGGHRLERSMMGRTSVSSSSDAHELPEIPIIGANLQSLILPRQSLLWAVLHRSDSSKRLIYSLTATFLGRMCLSGELNLLTPQQWDIVRKAEQLYQRVVPLLVTGQSRISQTMDMSWRYPTGRQAVVRLDPLRTRCLVLLHQFEFRALEKLPWIIKLPYVNGKNWAVMGELVDTSTKYQLLDSRLVISEIEAFSGIALYLERAG